MLSRKVVFLLTVVSWQLAMGLVVADSSSEEEQLRGIQAVTISVRELGVGKIIPNSTLKQQIQTDVELRLRLAGIKVIPKWKSYQQGELVVIIQWFEIDLENGQPTGNCAFNISVTLYTYIYAAWDTVMTPFYVGVWSEFSYGHSRASVFNECARETVKDLTDMFINDYLAVNTKDEDKEP